MKLTAHSEFGKIHSLMIKPVAAAFRNESHLSAQWKALNYLSQPDFKAPNLLFMNSPGKKTFKLIAFTVEMPL